MRRDVCNFDFRQAAATTAAATAAATATWAARRQWTRRAYVCVIHQGYISHIGKHRAGGKVDTRGVIHVKADDVADVADDAPLVVAVPDADAPVVAVPDADDDAATDVDAADAADAAADAADVVAAG